MSDNTTAFEQQWTREHDALIARVAERKIVEWHRRETRHPGICNDIGSEDFCSKGGPLPWQKGDWTPIASYSTDLAAIARAGEAWRTSDDEADRTIQVYSPVERPGLLFRAECCENYHDGSNYEWRTFKGEGETEVQARAWALWRACGGDEVRWQITTS